MNAIKAAGKVVIIVIVLALNAVHCFVLPPECNGSDQFSCKCTERAARADYC